jgi:hypothetical protein
MWASDRRRIGRSPWSRFGVLVPGRHDRTAAIRSNDGEQAGALRRALAIAFGILVALSSTGPVAAAYPPGTFPGAAPGGAFRTVVMSRSLCAAGGSLQASYDRSALILQVPAGALRACTQLSIYAAETAVIAPLLPMGAVLVDSFAVGWSPVGTTAKPLTLTINDAAITPGATVFETTTTGFTKLDSVAIAAGAVTMTFRTAPGYVVTMTAPSASLAASPQASASAVAGSADLSASPGASTPSGTTESTGLSGLLIAAFLLIVASIAAVQYRRSRRHR